jgi:hypothetical protein
LRDTMRRITRTPPGRSRRPRSMRSALRRHGSSRVLHDALQYGRSSMRAKFGRAAVAGALSRCENVDCPHEIFATGVAGGVENAVETRPNCQDSWDLGGTASASRCESLDYEMLSTSL